VHEETNAPARAGSAHRKKQSGTDSWLKRRNAWRTSQSEGQSAPAPVFTWPQWNNASIYQHLLPVLKEQTDAHCSFCDAYPVAGVSTETIEHFYPKTVEEFEHRVLEWENLFYACNGCQNAKGSKFHPALLKPDDPEYSFTRYFRFDFEIGEILPLALEGTPDYERAKETIEHYGLNQCGRPRHRVNARRDFIRANRCELTGRPYRNFLMGGGDCL